MSSIAVETKSHQNITVAIGESISLPASHAPSTSGRSPRIAESAVMDTGTIRSRDPLRIVFLSNGRPSSRQRYL